MVPLGQALVLNLVPSRAIEPSGSTTFHGIIDKSDAGEAVKWFALLSPCLA